MYNETNLAALFALVVDKWITLDNDVKNGEKSAQEVHEEFNRFMLAPAMAVVVLISTQPDFDAYEDALKTVEASLNEVNSIYTGK